MSRRLEDDAVVGGKDIVGRVAVQEGIVGDMKGEVAGELVMIESVVEETSVSEEATTVDEVCFGSKRVVAGVVDADPSDIDADDAGQVPAAADAYAGALHGSVQTLANNTPYRHPAQCHGHDPQPYSGTYCGGGSIPPPAGAVAAHAAQTSLLGSGNPTCCSR